MTNELVRSIGQDAWLAVRAFVRTPAFTSVAVLTLALGIGTNTAIFAMAHAVLWRPLPFAAPDQLVLIHETRLDTRVATYASLPNYLDWRDQAQRSFQGMAAYTDTSFHLTNVGPPRRLHATQVSADLFRLIGVEP